MKTFMQIAAIALILHTGIGLTNASGQTDSRYWDEHVALVDFRTRTIDQTSYVREIQVIDFKKTENLIPNFGLGEDLFADDGSGFDRKAGDGTYTSSKAYPHSAERPFVGLSQTSTAFDRIIIDKEFQHSSQLGELFNNNAGIIGNPTIELTIDCDVARCDCPSECLCLACDWGHTSWCLDWTNCNVKVTLGW